MAASGLRLGEHVFSRNDGLSLTRALPKAARDSQWHYEMVGCARPAWLAVSLFASHTRLGSWGCWVWVCEAAGQVVGIGTQHTVAGTWCGAEWDR